ncbi:hypothetical protein F183_A17880 [Bryobacterales bacterium F-183]|nr:hypothetical protein F183_A17880 [Bryobacterales bacterium F-183]
MYNEALEFAVRQERTTSYGVKGQLLKKPRVLKLTEQSYKQLDPETQRVMGMILAQRVRTLMVLALQERTSQEQLIGTLIQTVFADPRALLEPSEVPPGVFGGSGGNTEPTLRARGYARTLNKRIAQLQSLLADPTALSNEVSNDVNAQIEALRQKAERIALTKQERINQFGQQQRAQIQLLEAQRSRLQQQWEAYRQQGEAVSARGKQLQALGATATDPVIKQQYEKQIQELLGQANSIAQACNEIAVQIDGYTQEIQNIAEQKPEDYAQELTEEIAALERDAGRLHASRELIFNQRADQARRELAHLSQLVQAWKQKAEECAREDYQWVVMQRNELLRQSIVNDFALQQENYKSGDRPWVQALQTAVQSDPRAAHIFMSLHPRFKYKWSAPAMCRMTKLLTDGAPNGFLDIWHQLDQAGLSAPGPYARLGVFVMNSLSPGAYDDSHREMVQWELDQISQGMKEFGIGDRITCHSCGRDEFRDPNKSGWIRDHNPPTAMVELLDDFGIDLGLRFYTKTPTNTRQQILLPQCLGCSTRQSSIAARTKEILSANPSLRGQPADQVRTYLGTQLTPEELSDLLRLVLNPCVGWSHQGQSNNAANVLYDALGQAQLTFDPGMNLPTEIVTSGVRGSFAGVDNDRVAAMGDLYGCHTCIDVANQTDAYRGISWIADHQPPTALVMRGLAELPQLVLPHCHACSKKQSNLTRKLAAIFDGCYGKGWSDTWCQELGINQYDDVS